MINLSAILFGAGLLTAIVYSNTLLINGITVPLLFIYLSFFPYILKFFISREGIQEMKKDEVFLFLLSIWAIASNIWSVSPELTRTYSYYYLVIFLVYFIVRRTCTSRRIWFFYGFSYVVGCVFSSLLLLFNYSSAKYFSTNRYSIEGLNSNFVAYSLVTGMGILFILFFLEHSEYKYKQKLLLPLSVFISIGIFLTGSRSAFASLIVLSVFVFFKVLKKRSFVLLSVFIVILFCVYYLYLDLPEMLKLRLISLSDSAFDVNAYSNLSGRLELWPIAIETISENLLLGVGAGAFQSLNFLGVEAHNLLLNVCAELGFVGMGLYVLSIYNVLLHNWKYSESGSRKWATIFVFSVWFPVAMSGVWDVSYIAWFSFAWLGCIDFFEREAGAINAG